MLNWQRCYAIRSPTRTWQPCANCGLTPTCRTRRRSALQFGLAQVYDARGAYTEAAELLQQANVLAGAVARKRGQDYDAVAHGRFVDRMMAISTSAFFERASGFGLDSERPIFIIGLPRSGTTLTEQILASHSQIFGAGELRLARDEFEGLASRDNPAVDALAGLDQATARRLGERHLGRLQELNGDRLRVVDKMPDNYLYLGLLTVLFPRAKFIHCRRDLRDNAVSCWMTNFRAIRWANDPEHIVSRFHEYQRLMQHWREVLPVQLLDVDYEETVADVERTRAGWCSGVAWSGNRPACSSIRVRGRSVPRASRRSASRFIAGRSLAGCITKSHSALCLPGFERPHNEKSLRPYGRGRRTCSSNLPLSRNLERYPGHPSNDR